LPRLQSLSEQSGGRYITVNAFIEVEKWLD